MVEPHSPSPDRRRDPRVVIEARVRLSPLVEEGEIRADLVDVSAGGVRVRAAGATPLDPGTAMRIEILLERGTQRAGPEVRLRGEGVVVRSDPALVEGAAGEPDAEAPPGLDTALRFTGPLELREPFQQLLVF